METSPQASGAGRPAGRGSLTGRRTARTTGQGVSANPHGSPGWLGIFLLSDQKRDSEVRAEPRRTRESACWGQGWNPGLLTPRPGSSHSNPGALSKQKGKSRGWHQIAERPAQEAGRSPASGVLSLTQPCLPGARMPSGSRRCRVCICNHGNCTGRREGGSWGGCLARLLEAATHLPGVLC